MDLWMDGLTSQLGSPPLCGGTDQAPVEIHPQLLSQDLCNDNCITGTHVKVYNYMIVKCKDHIKILSCMAYCTDQVAACSSR